MPSVHTILRWVGAGLAVALQSHFEVSRAVAGGHHLSHHTTTVTHVAYVPVSTGVQTMAVQAPQLTTSFVAPLQMNYVQSQLQYAAPMQFQMMAPTFQMAAPVLTFNVPQQQAVPSAVGSLQSGQQPVLSASQLLFQQSLMSQMESSGWLKSLKDKLAQRLLDLKAFTGGNLPAKDAIVKFLLDEATAFLKNTPFGPFLPIIQPMIEKLIDQVIQEQAPATPSIPSVPPSVPPITPANGTVKRYIITLQEVDANGTVIPPGSVTPQVPVPGSGTSLPTRAIVPDADSPLEKPAAPPR